MSNINICAFDPGKIKPKSCPFCGKVEDLYLKSHVGYSIPQFSVVCLNCNAEGPIKDNKQDAWEAWNTRS